MQKLVMRRVFPFGPLQALIAVAWLLPSTVEAADTQTIRLAEAFATLEIQAETRFIDFGTPTARPYMVSGFSTDHRAKRKTLTWSLGKQSILRFMVTDSGPRRIVMACVPLRYPGAPDQALRLLLNGNLLKAIRLRHGPQRLKIELPDELLRVGMNQLKIGYSNVQQPSEVLPDSSDPRELAVAWDWMRVERIGRTSRARRPDLEPSVDLAGDKGNIALPEGYLLGYYARIGPGSKIAFSSLRDLNTEAELTDTKAAVRVYVETDEDGRLLEVVLGSHDISEPLLIPLEEARIARIVFGRESHSSPGILELGDAKLESSDPVVRRSDENALTPLLRDADASNQDSRRGGDDHAQALTALRSPGANIVLYVIDTLRADSLGAYGKDLPTSPRFDQLAGQGILFENALAVSSWTRPTVVSILTGLGPGRHGVVGRDDSLAQEARTLAEFLHAAGYRTGGFITNANVSAKFGVNQGFGAYEWYPHGKDKPDQAPRSSVLANKSALRWIGEGSPEEAFLAFVHISDPHGPYLPPKLERSRFAGDVSDPDIGTGSYLRKLADLKIPQSQAARRDLEALYSAEVAYADARLGEFLDGLDALGHGDDTLVVVVADHGEEFFDHGWSEHGKTLYEEQIHVPLAIRLPGGLLAGRRIESAIQQIDLLPTLLDILGLEAPPLIDGESALHLLTDESARPARPAFASLDIDDRRLLSVTERNLKLIEAFEYDHPKGHHPGLQLFDLSQDPHEKNDLSAKRPIALRYLQMKIRSEEREAEKGFTPEAAVLDAALIEELRALGYLE
jgi:arylsulfatase A-like enzyme